MIGRLVVDAVRPATPDRYPARAVVGEAVPVRAHIFRDGHDVLAGRVRWRTRSSVQASGGQGSSARTRPGTWNSSPLSLLGNDEWEGRFEPVTLGLHEFVVEGWTDRYATWRHKIEVKAAAGQDVAVEREEGALLLLAAAALVTPKAKAATSRKKVAGGDDVDLLTAAATALREGKTDQAFAQRVAELASVPDLADDLTTSPSMPLWVDRQRAMFSAWYELFPRSEGGLAGAVRRLPAIAEMGFDVLYLPPIHPIGRSHRKGRNNTLTPAPDDPGSPWAIGGPEGGHTTIHPDLGTATDLGLLVEKAAEHGIEIALDYALQCSPDHPWVDEHPEWFHRRPDGSIAYAENPPKKYQDIYPLNFWPADESDREALWNACRDVLEHWIERDIRIFRVDNPHTKPLAFWAWVIDDIHSRHPDVIFLAEAFTRPKVMAKLAEVGFSQSYTYFTWRTSAEELREYVTELSAGPTADYMRPNFWPNTPDILAAPLRRGGRAAFQLRAVLAALLVPSWGVYSGFELAENLPASEANEEYLDSEKFEIKKRNWDDPRSLAPYLARLNSVRRDHPALQELRNVRFHHSDNHSVLVWSKQTDDRSDVVLVCVNVDPVNAQETTVRLDLDALGLTTDATFEAHDELTGHTFTWQGPDQYVRLDPMQEPAHVLHIRS